jgi:4a-hydroxytetrahydrobiopterin dehydratase
MAAPERPRKLGDAEVAEALGALPGWALRAGKLHREFRFRNFNQAFGFMARAALHAEAMDHHPEWSNVYATVVVDLVTHSAHGITALDFELARKLGAIARELGEGADTAAS